MKELKVGNYIRTKDKKGVQYIRKIIDLPKDTRYGSIVVDKDIHNVKWVSKKNVLKVSEIIIDKDISDNDKLKFGDDDLVLTFKSNHDTYYLYIEDIENVVTKEQFESVKYEVKKDE